MKKQSDGNKIFENNKKCEKEFLKNLNLPEDTQIDENTFNGPDLDIQKISTVKAGLLTAFYTVRSIDNIGDKLYIPTKGKVQQVIDGEKDKKSGGPFLIQLTYEIRNKPVIAANYVAEEIVEVECNVYNPPCIIQYKDDVVQL